MSQAEEPKVAEGAAIETKGPANKINWKRVGIISAIATVVLLIAGGGYYYYQTKVANSGADTGTVADDQQQDLVTWQDPEKISTLGVYLAPTKKELSDNVYRSVADREKLSKYYKVGTVNTGTYAGGDVVLMVGASSSDGPDFSNYIYRFIKNEDKLYLLEKYSKAVDDTTRFDSSKYTVDKTLDISDLDFPNSFQDSANEETFSKDTKAFVMWSTDNLKEAFKNDTLGTVYTTKSQRTSSESYTVTPLDGNGFYVKSPDGTTVIYSLTINFMKESIPDVTFTDGSHVGDYSYTDRTGCGSSNYLSVPSSVTQAELTKTGQNKWGDSIYELTNKNSTILKTYYKNYTDTFYSEDGNKPVTYTEFLANHPIFFWETPYGQFVKFENTAYAMAAECGKPVIYLYPEQTTNVSVKVEPVGGMTYSDPKYNDGWNVVADTVSNIRDIITGKTYPYLFWEGRGGIYAQPKSGFVISRDEVHNFLNEKLSKYGLNSKEIADFEEFWEPRMKASPYYFVTFLGNSSMDVLAPLTINPAPDTVIRVLMDFSPLEKPVQVKGYEINTPVRKGFTVVEWGGVLREWKK